MIRPALLLQSMALLPLLAAPVHSQSALTTIDNPAGGKIVYGLVDGAGTEAGAMGTILGSLHRQYGDRPQVGRVFQVRDSNSAAVFFTLIKRNQGNAPIAGMLIASPSAGGVEAALLTDEAARFGATINPMLKSLFAAWHPAARAGTQSSPAGSRGGSAPIQALSPYVLPDKSASVSLPAGWKVDPTSGGGTILATGPNGEGVALDFPLNAWNSSDPRVQSTMQFARGAGRNTNYARALYYPHGVDLGKTFVDLLEMRARINNQPALSMQIDNETPLPGAGSRCARLQGHLDTNDGKGKKEFNTVFCSGALSPMGQYANIAFHTAIPEAGAAAQRATMEAILNSFQVNMGVVNREAAALAAPAIEQIHAIGRAAAAQAQQAHAMQDRQNQAVEARWDSQDKRNQAFSNYLLDQTVISDNQNSAHATVWNQTADALVKGNPLRFGYVDTPNFWKGVDY